MPTDTIIIVAGVVATFALFAAGLAFASMTSSK